MLLSFLTAFILLGAERPRAADAVKNPPVTELFHQLLFHASTPEEIEELNDLIVDEVFSEQRFLLCRLNQLQGAVRQYLSLGIYKKPQIERVRKLEDRISHRIAHEGIRELRRELALVITVAVSGGILSGFGPIREAYQFLTGQQVTSLPFFDLNRAAENFLAVWGIVGASLLLNRHNYLSRHEQLIYQIFVEAAQVEAWGASRIQKILTSFRKE